MTIEYILDLTDDLETLERDYANWLELPYYLKKSSDDNCIRRYGINNTELYTVLKYSITNTENENLSESDIDDEDIISKINRSKELQDSTGVVIIDDFIGDKPYTSYMDYLNNTLDAYNALPVNLKTMSDEDSLAIWGYNVPNMYNIQKNKYDDHMDDNPEDMLHMDTLQNYVSDVQESFKGDDNLSLLLRKLDIASYQGSLYESTVLDRLSTNIDDAINSNVDYSEDIPQVTPWFTPDEMEDLLGTEVDQYDYVLGNDIKNYNEKLKEASNNNDTDALIKLGWNPSIPYTAESAKFARDRQIRWFNENKQIQIVDLSRFDVLEEDTKDDKDKVDSKTKSDDKKEDDEDEIKDSDIVPIYITLINHGGLNSKVIRAYQGSNWFHAGLSFDSKLTAIYSFNGASAQGGNGLSVESLKFYLKAKDPQLKVIVVFVTKECKKKMKEYVQYYRKNEGKTKYDFKGLFDVMIHKSKDTAYSLSMICSQFVDSIMKAGKIDLTHKSSNLVTPKDLSGIVKPNKIFVAYYGAVKDYNQSKVDKKVAKIIDSTDDVKTIVTQQNMKEALELIFNKHDMNGFYTITENTEVNAVLEEIRNLFSPNAIDEVSNFPVRFDQDGGLNVDLPKDLEREYQEAHRLLISYNETNLEGIKRQLAKLFLINSIIEKKLNRKNKNDEECKRLTDLRARVLNDFKKYLKLVQSQEENFDFETYMKNSEYYNKTISVDRYTMKYSGKLIRDLIKMIFV